MAEITGISPEIKITARLKPAETSDVQRHLHRVDQAISTFFGGRIHLNPETLERIEIKDKTPLWRLIEPDTIGYWHPKHRRIVIFGDRDSKYGSWPWRQTLGDEVGHALCSQLLHYTDNKIVLDRTGKEAKPVQTGYEAFAEWIRVIINNEGNGEAVNKNLGIHLTHGLSRQGEHQVFEDARKNDYPPTDYKLRDAAILNYVYRRWGMNQVIQLVEQLSRQVSIRKAPRRTITLGEELEGKYADFEKWMKLNMHVSSSELFKRAQTWYEQGSPRVVV